MTPQNLETPTTHTNQPDIIAYRSGQEVAAFDLDGTLADYSKGWMENIGEPIPHVVELLVKEFEAGSFCMIFSARCNSRVWGADDSEKQIINVWLWLEKHDLKKYIQMIVGDKPVATRYYDDRTTNPITGCGHINLVNKLIKKQEKDGPQWHVLKLLKKFMVEGDDGCLD